MIGVCTSPQRRGASGMLVPCTNCLSCRLLRAAMWQVRGIHERSMHVHSCSITLTYNSKHVPWSGLQKFHLQDFFKRFRSQLVRDSKPSRRRGIVPRTSYNFRYMACGEYGDDEGRPHFHAVLFGFDFDDKYFWRRGKLGHKIYRSDFLESLWKFGNSEIGGADDEMISYLSRYILKKITGEKALTHYADTVFCADTGQPYDFLRMPEFFLSSKKPAIGLSFLEEYWDDIFALDECVINGKKRPIPVYYLNKLRDRSELLYQSIKRDRAYAALDKPMLSSSEDLTRERFARNANLQARMGLYS